MKQYVPLAQTWVRQLTIHREGGGRWRCVFMRVTLEDAQQNHKCVKL